MFNGMEQNEEDDDQPINMVRIRGVTHPPGCRPYASLTGFPRCLYVCDCVCVGGYMCLLCRQDFDDNQMDQVREQIRLVTDREVEINQLARSIAELTQIFRDMQTLVLDQVCTRNKHTHKQRETRTLHAPHGCTDGELCGWGTQGTLVDRIDYNIQQTVILTQEAHKELVQSNKESKKYRTRLCILLLIAVAVALVLTLAFRPKSSGTEVIIITPAPPVIVTPTPTPSRAAADALAATLAQLLRQSR
jgi:hypothetical protein